MTDELVRIIAQGGVASIVLFIVFKILQLWVKGRGGANGVASVAEVHIRADSRVFHILDSLSDATVELSRTALMNVENTARIAATNEKIVELLTTLNLNLSTVAREQFSNIEAVKMENRVINEIRRKKDD
jgi:hypothetical protein